MAWQRFRVADWLVAVMGVALAACGTEPSPAPSPRVYINEVMSSHNFDYDNGYGEYPDWIELYNAGDEDVDLKGYYVGDSARNRLDERVQTGTVGEPVVVPAQGFQILWADGGPVTADPVYGVDGGTQAYPEAEPHLRFKLSAEGEAVWLTDPNGYVLSYTEFGPFPLADAGNGVASWARFPDGTGEFQWCTKPTFRESNGSACLGQVVP